MVVMEGLSCANYGGIVRGSIKIVKRSWDEVDD